MADIRLLYPGSPVLPESVMDVESVVPVAADVLNPAGDAIVEVGNAAFVAATDAPSSDFSTETVGGSSRLVYENLNLANRVRVGDTVTFDIDGTEYTNTVYDINTLTGEVYFEDVATPTIAQINAGSVVEVNVDESEAFFNGQSTRISRYNQTAVASPTDTPISTQVVYIQDTVYENASFSADANTLYLIWEA